MHVLDESTAAIQGKRIKEKSTNIISLCFNLRSQLVGWALFLIKRGENSGGKLEEKKGDEELGACHCFQCD